jgi:hypothetical protein
MELNFFSDPSHGWLEVDLDLLAKYGIKHEISEYSYIRGDKAYLEEDLDAGTFMRELKVRGITLKINEIHTDYDAPIRNYQRFDN